MGAKREEREANLNQAELVPVPLLPEGAACFLFHFNFSMRLIDHVDPCGSDANFFMRAMWTLFFLLAFSCPRFPVPFPWLQRPDACQQNKPRYNEMRISQVQQEQESVQYKSRTSRLAKWRELAVMAQKELQLPPAAPETLMRLGPGNVVLFQLPAGKDHSGIELGFVVSVWKGVKAPKLHSGQTNVNSCVSFRVHPEDGDGQLKVVLTSESAEVLEKVPGLQRWHVGPPMTRGSKSLSVAPKAKAKPKASHVRPKKKEKPTVEETEPTEADIKRTKAGRKAIQDIMNNLIELDDKINPTVPAFDYKDFGKCRLKFEGASTLTWDILLEAAPDSFECMCRGLSSAVFDPLRLQVMSLDSEGYWNFASGRFSMRHVQQWVRDFHFVVQCCWFEEIV
eukprot:s1840_g10.t1